MHWHLLEPCESIQQEGRDEEEEKAKAAHGGKAHRWRAEESWSIITLNWPSYSTVNASPLAAPHPCPPPLHRPSFHCVHDRLGLPTTPNPRFFFVFFFHPEAPNQAATTDAHQQQRRPDTRGNLQVGQSPHKQATRMAGWVGEGRQEWGLGGGAGRGCGEQTKTAEGATEGLLCLAAAVLRVCHGFSH